jgi:glucosyl-dolichyl phosphate glucuronosyltransferase
MSLPWPSNQTIPAITIAICTQNRAELLRETLTSLTRLCRPTSTPCEVLVVCHGCTDETHAVLEDFVDRLPLRWVEESLLELSHARNRAVREARGRWIAWTDDDVQVEPDWIQQYLRGIERHPDASFLGGTIIPRFVGANPPAWLVRGIPYLAAAYAMGRRREEPFKLAVEFLPFGANFAVHRETHLSYEYRTDWEGRNGEGVALGEEEELLCRLIADGHRGYWVPQAKVYHWMPPERATFTYLRSYFHAAGQTSTRTAICAPSRWRLAWRALRTECLYRLARLSGCPEWWVHLLKESSYRWGQLAGASREESTESLLTVGESRNDDLAGKAA